MRTFYRKHIHTEKLPPNLPLLVFIHGLGGNITQWNPLLNSLVNVAPCLAIDLPGCGGSNFSPTDPEAYTTTCLAELLHSAIERFRNKEVDQQVILIGHSYGCSLAALLASSSSPLSQLCSDYTIGMIAICPRSLPLSESELKGIKTLSWIPTPIFAVLRMFDRRGGLNSTSVSRMAGKKADAETRKLQLRFNQQSRSAVWKTMTIAMASQELRVRRRGEASLLSQRIWEGIKTPLLLIAAKDDTVTKPEEAEQIRSWLQKAASFVKLITFDSPAAHSLMFSPRTIRSLSGHIERFLADPSIDTRLSAGWQLVELTTTGDKWDVKNFEKWSKVAPCSAPIASIFRALKTMRQGDTLHCPQVFARRYAGDGGVKAVVDISRDQPVYSKDDLENAGVQYHKFPTVSKQLPTIEDVSGFCALVDRLRDEFNIRGKIVVGDTIGVHCHYGFNRTGFLIVAYLIEKEGWKVQDAVAEFESKRPPGIKHQHFIDELHVRYESG